MRKAFTFTFDESLKDRAKNYCNRQMPRKSLSNLIHQAVFEFLAREDNQLEEVEN
jgi:predicted transcriptional regulator